MRARREVRKKADMEKAEIMAQFEKMKRKGKIDEKVIAKLGLDGGKIKGTGMSTMSSSPMKRAHSSYMQSGRNSQMNSKSYRQYRGTLDSNRGAGQRSAQGADFSKEVQFLKTKQMSAVEAKKKVDELRMRLNKELMDILELEQQRENERELQIQAVIVANP